MWHTTRKTYSNDCTYIFKAAIMSNHCPLMLWHLSSYLKTKIFPRSHLQWQLCLIICLLHYNMHSSRWKIPDLPHVWTDYSSSGTPSCTVWTIGSTQPEGTQLHPFWGECLQHSLPPTKYKKWFICWMKSSWWGWWLLLIWSLRRICTTMMKGMRVTMTMGSHSQVMRPIHVNLIFITKASFDLAEIHHNPVTNLTPHSKTS